jgi:hypothetical protein
MGQYENIFGCKPREYTSPLEKGDHPEVDSSDEFDEEGIKRYQTLIECLQLANGNNYHVTLPFSAATRTPG